MLVISGDVPRDAQVEYLGAVRGNVVYCKNIGRDIMASFKNLAGGEIKSYTQLTDEAREIACNRMVEEAEKLGANAVICMRFSSASIDAGTIDMLCYGTAVKLS